MTEAYPFKCIKHFCCLARHLLIAVSFSCVATWCQLGLGHLAFGPGGEGLNPQHQGGDIGN